MRILQLRRRAMLLATLAAVSVSIPGTGFAGQDQQARYDSSGTRVVRIAGVTLVDEGSMTCSASTGAGVGGSCLRFDPTNPTPAVSVVDASPAIGTHVAYQVCLDNNGDSACTSPPESGPCPDDIVFSHSDGGAFSNPLAVAPGFRPGCPGGPFPGYVVFICSGAHVDGSAHTHDATTGTTQLVAGGGPSGNFCGGTAQRVSRKHYTVNP
jgi:hypothetical protein